MSDTQVLLLPGWQNSDPEHWQSRWETLYGDKRVEQHDWMRPLRGDWQVQLEEAVLATDRPVVLVAHSLGCVLAAAWALHSRHTHKVRGALLVAPADLERDDLRQLIPGWSPIGRQRLPFAAHVVASSNDPYSDFARSRHLAADWGARFSDVGPLGHINAESGLGNWPEGRRWLQELQQLKKD
ncbi:RBBP9/YdeN family alpha/beta hydrolase [Variovorax sp. LARHSF232]